MEDFTKVEKVAVKYLLEWGSVGKVDFPDLVVSSYFDLISGDKLERQNAIKNLLEYIQELLGEEKSKQVVRELKSCVA